MTEILNDDDHASLMRGVPTIDYARAVERAVISRLAEMGGELPEPSPARQWLFHVYSADQMHAHYAKGVAAGVAAERDALAALLTEARGAVAYANYHGASGAPDALLARIDAALAAKEQSK
jgi:hypothetical protein